jgi:hypothetical protein
VADIGKECDRDYRKVTEQGCCTDCESENDGDKDKSPIVFGNPIMGQICAIIPPTLATKPAVLRNAIAGTYL